MKESKPYPIFDEEDGSCLTAAEPAGATAYAEPYTHAEAPHIPGLPETWDELLECLKEGEEEIERGDVADPYVTVLDEINSQCIMHNSQFTMHKVITGTLLPIIQSVYKNHKNTCISMFRLAYMRACAKIYRNFCH